MNISRFRCGGKDPIDGFFENELYEPIVNPPQGVLGFEYSSAQDRMDDFENLEPVDEVPF